MRVLCTAFVAVATFFPLVFPMAAEDNVELETPLARAQDLLRSLATAIDADAKNEAVAYRKYASWCKNTLAASKSNVEQLNAQKGKLDAAITKAKADSESSAMRIEEIASSLSAADAELKKTTVVHEKEARDSAAAQKQLAQMSDAIGRAVTVLEKELKKGVASLAQLDGNSMDKVLAAFAAVLDAAALPAADKDQLLGLMQNDDDNDKDKADRQPAVKRASGLIETLQDLKERADEELRALRVDAKAKKHQYEKLKASIEQEIAAMKKELALEKSEKAAAEEARATGKGDLVEAVEELKNSDSALKMLRDQCKKATADHKETVAARNKEIQVIDEATKALDKACGEGSASLLQLKASLRVTAGSRTAELVRRLARRHHSSALAQLASRLGAIARYSADPFTKVKKLIEEMITKLQQQAAKEASEKAYCDAELKSTKARKDALGDGVAKLATKIEQGTANLAELKEEMAQLESAMAELTRKQAEMDKMRQESHAYHVQSKKELVEALTGVRKALTLLREYYAKKDGDAGVMDQEDFKKAMQNPQAIAPAKHLKSTTGAQGVIGLLEVVDADTISILVKEETQEQDEESRYLKGTQENKVLMVQHKVTVAYKLQESKALSVTLRELASNKESAAMELAAVDEFDSKLKERCSAKPDTFEERMARRRAEISGLEQALAALEEEKESFAQLPLRRYHAHKRLRGNRRSLIALSSNIQQP